MSTEALVIVVSLVWGILMLRRIHRKRQQRIRDRKNDGAAPAKAARDAAERSMPRSGKPGSMTRNQKRALWRSNFQPDMQWSSEEAALILDAVRYLNGVCRDVADTDDGPPPLEIQNNLLRLILTQQDLRDYVRKWGEDRREAGVDDDGMEDLELARNQQYERVADAARNYLTPPPAEA
jgi:hypothetical protein